MAGGQLDLVYPIRILDDEFSTVIFLGLSEEEGRRQIRANSMRRSGNLSNGIIDVSPEPLSILVTIKQRREKILWECLVDKKSVTNQGFQDYFNEFYPPRVVPRQVYVVLF